MNISTASNLLDHLSEEWKSLLSDILAKDYALELSSFLDIAYSKSQIYPPRDLLFTAFNNTKPKDVRVVILGQDPYHGPSQAHGLSFSVPMGSALPPSLKNIFKELVNDLNCGFPFSGDLTPWAKQGVLLLNTTLSVEHKKPGSHFGVGWEQITEEVLKVLNQMDRPVVYILWGAHAHEKAKHLTNSKHLILKAPHPSPLSSYRGFFGSKPFSKTNDFLTANGQRPIEWEL